MKLRIKSVNYEKQYRKNSKNSLDFFLKQSKKSQKEKQKVQIQTKSSRRYSVNSGRRILDSLTIITQYQQAATITTLQPRIKHYSMSELAQCLNSVEQAEMLISDSAPKGRTLVSRLSSLTEARLKNMTGAKQ